MLVGKLSSLETSPEINSGLSSCYRKYFNTPGMYRIAVYLVRNDLMLFVGKPQLFRGGD